MDDAGAASITGFAVLLQAIAESATGDQGGLLWNGLADLIAGGADGQRPGVAEFTALRQDPADLGLANALAGALLRRADADERFRDALRGWRGQPQIQAMERALGHQIPAAFPPRQAAVPAPAQTAPAQTMPARREAQPVKYDAFISYSHEAHRVLARALQARLERFARPWYKFRALRVFLDNANLAANASLWRPIEEALASSEWLVLFASAQAAASEWVDREVSWWLENRSLERILIVTTSEDLKWDKRRNDWADPTLLPPALRGVFPEEPHLARLADVEVTGGQRPIIVDAQIADVAAPLRGMSKDQLAGEQLRQHRRTIRTAGAAIAVLVALTAVSVAASILAIGQRNDARAQAQIAISHDVANIALANLDGHLDIAQLLAVEAVKLDNDPESRAALFQAATASPDLQRYLEVGAQVTALATAADGDVAVAGTVNGLIVRFDLATGSRTQVAAGHQEISAVTVSADGSMVAAENQAQAFLWNAASGHPPAAVPAQGEVSSVALSPSGRLLAVLSATAASSSSGGSEVLAVRNVHRGDRIQAEASNGVTAGNLAFPSESLLTVAGAEGGFQQYAPSGLHLIAQSGTSPTPANSYAYGTSPNGAFSGFLKLGELQEWPTAVTSVLAQEKQTMVGNAPIEPASYLTFSDDGKQAASIENGMITVSPMAAASASFAGASTVTLAGSMQTAVSFLTDDQLVAASGAVLALWDLQRPVQLGGPTAIPVAGAQVLSASVPLVMSQDGRYLAVANYNLIPGGSNMGADQEPQEVVSVYRAGDTLTPDGHWQQTGTPVWDGDTLLLAGYGASGRVQVARPGGAVLGSWPSHNGPLFGGIGFSAHYISSREIIVLDGDGIVSFDPQTGQGAFRRLHITGVPRLSSGEVTAFSPDGRAVLLTTYRSSAANTPATVIYVNLQTGAAHVVAAQASTALFAGDRVLVQLSSGAVQEWNATGTRLLQTLPAIGTSSFALTASPDGTMLAQVSNDGVASITDLATGQTLASFDLPISSSMAPYPAEVTTMIFSPDQRYLLTATPGEVLSRWDIGEQSLIKLACNRAGHPLTDAIWAQYVHTTPPAGLACQR